MREARDLLDGHRLEQERGRGLAAVDGSDRLVGERRVGDALRRERLDDARAEVVVGRDAGVACRRDRASTPPSGRGDLLAGDVADLLDDPMGREDLEPRRARRDEDREGVRRLRMLLPVGDRRLVAVVAVGDQKRRVDLELTRFDRPDPRPDTALGRRRSPARRRAARAAASAS